MMETRKLIVAGIATCIACGLAGIGTVGAQPVNDPLRPGARVRVVDTASRSTALTGTLVRWQHDTVVVVDGRGATALLRMRQWHRMDVSVARRRHVVRNGFIGAAAGAVVVGAIGAAVVDPQPSRSDSCVPLGPPGSCWSVTVGGTPRSMGAAVGAAYGAVLGGLAGGITGMVRRDQWVPVSRDIQMAFAPVAGGAAMTVRVPIGRSFR